MFSFLCQREEPVSDVEARLRVTKIESEVRLEMAREDAERQKAQILEQKRFDEAFLAEEKAKGLSRCAIHLDTGEVAYSESFEPQIVPFGYSGLGYFPMRLPSEVLAQKYANNLCCGRTSFQKDGTFYPPHRIIHVEVTK